MEYLFSNSYWTGISRLNHRSYGSRLFKFIFLLGMASQPPLQYNPMSPSIPNTVGLSRPPILQASPSNGMGQLSGSTFPLPSTSNFAPVLSNTSSSQWSRAPIPGQGSAPTPISQSSSISNQQQYNPAIHGPNSPRPAMPTQNLGRPPNTSAINSFPSGID